MRVVLAISAVMAATSLPAQTSGMLLGYGRNLTSEVKPTTSRYETLWIVRSKERPLRARLADLIVPRADGFWRVGVAATCLEDGEGIDEVWRVRAEVRPIVRSGCPTVQASSIEWNYMGLDSADRAKLDSETVVCEISSQAIVFLSPNHIQIQTDSRMTEQCEPRGDRAYMNTATRRWDSDSAYSFLDIAGEAAHTALARAVRTALTDTTADECEDFVSVEATEYDEAEFRDWDVVREKGRWHPRIYRRIYGSPCSQEAMIDWTLPASFTGHDALRPSWSVVAARVSGLTDAFASPNGDMIIAVAADSLFAFESDGAGMGAQLLAMKFQGRIVMAQWALGKHVARWDLQLARLRPKLRPAIVKHAERR